MVIKNVPDTPAQPVGANRDRLQQRWQTGRGRRTPGRGQLDLLVRCQDRPKNGAANRALVETLGRQILVRCEVALFNRLGSGQPNTIEALEMASRQRPALDGGGAGD